MNCILSGVPLSRSVLGGSCDVRSEGVPVVERCGPHEVAGTVVFEGSEIDCWVDLGWQESSHLRDRSAYLDSDSDSRLPLRGPSAGPWLERRQLEFPRRT